MYYGDDGDDDGGGSYFVKWAKISSFILVMVRGSMWGFFGVGGCVFFYSIFFLFFLLCQYNN